jgi:hypothetical protein
MQEALSSLRPRGPTAGRLHDERIVPLCVVHCDAPERRQLQHGRALTFAQMRQQDDFSVGKLKGVMRNV